MIRKDENLLDYFRSRPCDLCGQPAPSDPHHVKPKGIGGGSRLDVTLNLVSLCRTCHNGVHAGVGSALCWLVIEEREGLEPGMARAAVDKLLRSPK